MPSLSWQRLPWHNLYRHNDFHDTISIMANFVMTLIGNNICLHPSFQNNASLWDEATLSWFLYKIKRRFVHNKNLARPKYCQTLFVSQWLLYLLLYTCTCKIFQTHPSPLDVTTRCGFFSIPVTTGIYVYMVDLRCGDVNRLGSLWEWKTVLAGI